MKKLNLRTGIFVGAFLSASLTAIMYLAYQLADLPYVPFDFFDWMTRVLPGPVVTFGIDLMIDTMLWLGISVANSAKTAEQIIAVLQFFIGGTLAGTIFYAVVSYRKIKPDVIAGLVMAALFGLPLITISAVMGQSRLNPVIQIIWLILLFSAWGLALSWSFQRFLKTVPAAVEKGEDSIHTVKRIDRRRFIIQLGTATATITVIGTTVGEVLSLYKKRNRDKALMESMAHNTEGGSPKSFPNQDDPVTPAPGTRPEYTPVKDHYKVFIRTQPTIIDGSSWKLPVTGMVENTLMLTLDDLKNNYTPVARYVTISCISGRVGTSLIGTTLWTGARLKDVLADARVKPGAKYLYITSGDGYYETLEMEQLAKDDRIMLCYAWDGHDLSHDHGFPLRIWIPDRYGMKQPKWITGIEVTDTYKPGYWVERNWDRKAQVKTTSVIDTVAVNALVEKGNKTLVPVGGIAFSGARGISKVEVRVNDGPWQQSELRAPLSDTTWVIWYYTWPFEKGEFTFEVRCAEADGTKQIEEKHPARPSGATGLDSKTVKI